MSSVATMKRLLCLCLLAGLWAGAALATAPLPARADDQTSAVDDPALRERAKPYMDFADQILAAITTGQTGALRASLSPSTLASWRPGDVDLFVHEIVAPYFADYASPVNEQWVAPTAAPAGFTGFAFYRSFTATDGRTKPYVLYVLDEDGRMVVGNILVGRTFQDMNPQP